MTICPSVETGKRSTPTYPAAAIRVMMSTRMSLLSTGPGDRLLPNASTSATVLGKAERSTGVVGS